MRGAEETGGIGDETRRRGIGGRGGEEIERGGGSEEGNVDDMMIVGKNKVAR
jgi:hypothetical protein